jgi:hypothetical protein
MRSVSVRLIKFESNRREICFSASRSIGTSLPARTFCPTRAMTRRPFGFVILQVVNHELLLIAELEKIL